MKINSDNQLKATKRVIEDGVVYEPVFNQSPSMPTTLEQLRTTPPTVCRPGLQCFSFTG